VKFTTAIQTTTGAVDASIVSYEPPFTGSVATNVEDKLAQYVSVKDFGAVGDGVADDTAAIQAALDSGAGAVYFPENYTYLTETVSVPSNIMLHGRGTLKLKANTNKWIIENADLSSGNTNIRIYDLTLDGNKDNQSGTSLLYGVYFSRVTDSIIEGLKINNCKEDAILLGSSGFNEKCERVKVLKNICTNNSRNGISIVAGDFCEVRMNTVVGCAGLSATENAGIDIEADNANVSVSYNDVTDNVVMNVGGIAKAGRGITCVNAVFGTMTDNNISQNRIYNCGSYGIELQDLSFVTANNNDISNCGIDEGQATSGIYVLNCDDASINDNRVRFQGSLAVLGGPGIFLNASDRATINSNKCISNYGNGIDIRGSRQGTCNDNLIANSGVGGTSGLGINLQTAGGVVPSGWDISGNRCYDSAGASGSQAYGIYLTNAESCNVSDNTVFGNRTAGMVESGTTNSIRSNFGYDPLGYWATPPAIPASLSSVTNTSNHPCFVVIEGGTDVITFVGGTQVTALAVAAPALTVLVEPGQTIGLVYTLAPTWRWFRR
jgi:parallel beta-helix repeat protein